MDHTFQQQPTENGEPVFDTPWQAKTFAMAIKLNEASVFTWSEWAEELSIHIKAFEKHSTIENNEDYYKLWQKALESLVEKKLSLTT